MKILVGFVIVVAAVVLSAPGCVAQDTLWKDDGVSFNAGGWFGAGMNESIEGPVNYGAVGLGFHSDNYALGIGFARGNARTEMTNGGYFTARFQVGKSIIDAEYDYGKGSSGTSQTVVVGTTPGFIYESNEVITHKAHVGYWRQIRSSVFYWGGQCMYLTGERQFNEGGSASVRTIDQHILSKELNAGIGLSAFVWTRYGFILSGTIATGVSGSRYQEDFKETDTQSRDVISEKHETLRTDIGMYTSIRVSVGWVIGRR